MGKVHFIGGEKGGVGKSMTARLLAQYYIDKKAPFIGFDCDDSHGTFSRFYDEYASSVVVGNDDSLDGILEAAEVNPDSDMIIDLAAQTSKPLNVWIEETDVFNLFNELGYQVYLWHVTDGGADSVGLLDKSLSNYPEPELQFVVVKNKGRGDCFRDFEQSDTFEKAGNRGSHFFEMGKLQAKLTQKIDFSNTSFWAAANNRKEMNIAERQRVRIWLKNNYHQIDRIMAAYV